MSRVVVAFDWEIAKSADHPGKMKSLNSRLLPSDEDCTVVPKILFRMKKTQEDMTEMFKQHQAILHGSSECSGSPDPF